jgi:alpha-tubulin suppressor-like RCC1 family protein
LTGVAAIAAGQGHVVALKSDGTVVAWGNNYYGQTTVPAGLSGVTAIAAGVNQTVALKSDGTVVAWGITNAGGPTDVPAGLNGVVAIATGEAHTVALKSDGTVVAWGLSGAQTDVPSGLNGVRAIAAGGSHNLALKNNGTVVAWGVNASGVTNVPTGLSGVTAIACGYSHNLALKSDGTVVAWGDNYYGQTTGTSNGITSAVTANPVTLNTVVLSGVTAVAAGHNHSVALKSDGTLVAWGSGRVNTGASSQFGQSIIPTNLSGVTAIAAGGAFTVAVGIVSASITAQPVNQSFSLGGGATFGVDATGTGLSYQWQFNGTNIIGATSPTLSLSNLSLADAGPYRVRVSGISGSTVTSQTANLSFFGDLKFLATATLAGSVGQQFRVDYAEVLVGVTNWLTLTNVTLPISPYVVIDPDSRGRTNRYYRAVPLP